MCLNLGNSNDSMLWMVDKVSRDIQSTHTRGIDALGFLDEATNYRSQFLDTHVYKYN